jgi:hypothetical protein
MTACAALRNHKVGLVVDRNFATRIDDIARLFHVWIVSSPNNTPAIDRFCEAERGEPAADPLGSGITTFEASELESAAEMCARIAEDIDEHHNELAHDPPWSEIEVYGVALDVRLRGLFTELGAMECERTDHGFVCRR